MLKSFPWLPIGTHVVDGVAVGRVLSEGEGYQVVSSRSTTKSILLIDQHADWTKDSGESGGQLNSLIQDGVLVSYSFGEADYWVGVFTEEDRPVRVRNLAILPNFGSGAQLLNFAEALAKMAEKCEGATWSNALYFPREELCLAVDFRLRDEDKRALAVGLLTGGVSDSELSPTQIRALNPWITVPEIEQFLSVLGLAPETRAATSTKPVRKPEDFRLPGRPKLEAFFREYVIDYFYRRNEYDAMGIKPPNGILLSGRPGTGKTHAVQALANFLGWSVYDIDVATVGSPYIHQTSKTLSKVFDIAAENPPSIVLMEEIDALTGNRNVSMDSHKVEEVSQMLRLLEKAADRGILVIATSNRSYAMDHAITRRGRFDHVIEVAMPQAEEILAVLEGMLNDHPTVGGINLEEVVQSLEGRPMSDVAWVVNDSARIAVKSQKKQIDASCLLAAVENLESQ